MAETKEAKKTICVQMPMAMFQDLGRIAEREKALLPGFAFVGSRSEIVRQAIRKFIDAYPAHN